MPDLTVCFAGPMLGGRPGWVPNPAELLARRFEGEGVECRLTSTQTNRFLRVLDTVWCLLRWRRKVDVAVVMLYSGHAFAVGAITVALARLLRLPVVLHLHGGNLPDLARRRPRAVRRVFRWSQAAVAPSTFLAHTFRTMPGEVTVIPNLLDIGQYEYGAREVLEPRILWMRTFHATYDPASALRVVRRLRDGGIEATLTMAGQDQGALEDTLAAARRLGLGDAVEFVGFLDPAGKRVAFREHSIFLNTTRIDNAPVTLLEAAASGLPIVSTDVGGISHLFTDGVDARLVRAGDDEQMASAITALLAEPARARQLAAAARSVALDASWTHVQEAWRAVLDRAVTSA